MYGIKYFLNIPFDYFFIDEDYDNLFRTQIRLTRLLKYFTILAVLIACLGLYGLSAYSAERRTNEIGIRKVMGAGTLTILYSMVKEFMVLVFISLIIAVPAGWIIVGKPSQPVCKQDRYKPPCFCRDSCRCSVTCAYNRKFSGI